MKKLLKLKNFSDLFATTLKKYSYSPSTNDVLAGTVVAIERNQGIIHLGLNHVGFLPKQEICMDSSLSLFDYFYINYIGEFLIVKLKDYEVIVSLQRLHQNRLWERLRQIHVSYMILYPKTERSTWGGKIINFDGIKLFSPNSHIPKYYRREQRKDLTIPLTLFKIKRKAAKIKILGSLRFAYVKKHSSFLKVGMIHYGCINSMKRFGIFLTLFGVKCLLHISEISDKKIQNLNLHYKKGNKLKVLIIYINRSRGQIALSAKRV